MRISSTDNWPITIRDAVAECPIAFDNAVWFSYDHDRGEWVIDNEGPTSFRVRIIQSMIQLPNGFIGHDLSEASGIPTRSIPPVLRGISDRCRRVRRVPLWQTDQAGRYAVDLAVREVFSDILSAIDL